MAATTIDRARAGDERAFAALTAVHHRELHAHCYRMLGSVDDADDVLQETLLAAWRGLAGFAGDASLRTWLYTIATRRCLNAIRDAKRRPPPVPRAPFEPPPPSRREEVTWLQPYPDSWLDGLADPAAGPEHRQQRRASTELAVIAALQRLPPRQTAAVVLCDVLDFSLAESARILGEPSQTVVKGLLQRGRAALARARPDESQVAPDSAAERDLSARFADAFAADDVDGVIALLTDGAWLAMPPAPHQYHGREAIAAFLRASATARRGRHFALVATRANTQPAFISSLGDELRGVVVLRIEPIGVAAITHFLDPRLARRVADAAGTDGAVAKRG